MRPPRSVEWLLFAASFASFAYFHSGGGWGQNARFAQIRAIVEDGRLSIDSFLVYRIARSTPTETHLERLPVDDGEVRLDGRTYALAWVVDSAGDLEAVNGSTDSALLPLHTVAASGDVTYARAHFYPNKTPGLTLLAVPGYWLLHQIDRWTGADPDDAWTLTKNAWLTSVLSVGLVSAIGCVVFFRVASKLSPQGLEPALLATIAFGWGTIYLPFATMLFEHNLMAVAELGAFSAVLAAHERQSEGPSLLPAGLLAGGSILANYIGAAPAGLLAAYTFLRRGPRHALWFLAGVIPALFVIGLYDLACFGSLLTTSYTPKHPGLQSGALFLGLLGMPRSDILFAVLFSPYRGLLYGSPFLVFGVVGLARLCGDRRWRADALLFGGIVAFFLVFNSAYSFWDGGSGTGPRFLLPALPFLALPAVLAFATWRKTSCVVAAWSVLAMLLATAVDPLSPIGNRDFALYPQRPLVRYDPLLDYDLPLFLEESPAVLRNAGIEAALARYGSKMRAAGRPKAEVEHAVAAMRSELLALGPRVPPEIVPISAFHGPVSVNPVGIFEAAVHQLSPANSALARWNSFNVGEFLRPESRLSLLPLLVMISFLMMLAAQRCRLAPGDRGL